MNPIWNLWTRIRIRFSDAKHRIKLAMLWCMWVDLCTSYSGDIQSSYRNSELVCVFVSNIYYLNSFAPNVLKLCTEKTGMKHDQTVGKKHTYSRWKERTTCKLSACSFNNVFSCCHYCCLLISIQFALCCCCVLGTHAPKPKRWFGFFSLLSSVARTEEWKQRPTSNIIP